MKLAVFFFTMCCFSVFSQDDFSIRKTDSTLTGESNTKRILIERFIYQNRILPIESYFRDRLFIENRADVPTFPMENGNTFYFESVSDTKKRYSNVGYFLFNRELVQLHDKNNYLWITPLLDVSLGRDLVADTLKKISQNTRGVRIEGNFNNRVLFTTSFYENQAVLPNYAAQYALSKGEFFPNQSNGTYSQVNAVISGAARTKPFETNGFDYAYAVGSVLVRITDKMNVSWGNNSLFVGSGYRSMLWSDHSLGAMNLRFQWKFADKWSFQMVRMRGMNLMRRIGGVNGEAFYEPTSLSMSTLYFSPTPKISIGLFEGGVWNRGDSIQKSAVSPLYFIPLPGASTLEESVNGNSNTVLGLDGNVHTKIGRFYGQFALNPFIEKSSLFQVGVRLFTRRLPGSWIQAEYNEAGEKSYASANPRMNYASNNLPLAHPAGTNFREFLVRTNYEINHWYASASFHYYPKQAEQSLLLPVYQSTAPTFQTVVLTVFETGYKFNRTYGLECFAQFRYRKSDGTTVMEGSWLSAGIRTAIRNHYFDY